MVTEENKSGSPRKWRVWLWLLFGALATLIVAGVYAYLELTVVIEDLSRTWDDLVQLFWLIIPDAPR